MITGSVAWQNGTGWIYTRLMKKIVVLTLVVIALGAGVYFIQPSPCGASCDKKAATVQAQEFFQQTTQKGSTLIDVRTPEEYASGHIEGSTNSDYNNQEAFIPFLNSLDKNGAYLVYCRSGNRSAKAMKLMEEKGFINITNLSGGIIAWQAAALPLVSQ